ncbi:hypothetical protein C0995_003979 [Termitomyces sp. Mi166|nr:hypothetical protein C0995_003979 [Termitomyces sp. Mi166\
MSTTSLEQPNQAIPGVASNEPLSVRCRSGVVYKEDQLNEGSDMGILAHFVEVSLENMSMDVQHSSSDYNKLLESADHAFGIVENK